MKHSATGRDLRDRHLANQIYSVEIVGEAVREADIKAAVVARLRKDGDISSRSVLATEYPIGRTGVRADLAILQGTFVGIEIKSQHDSLRRLQRQLSAYRQFFDRTILVVAERHLAAVQKLMLEGIELWVVHGSSLQLISVDSRPSQRLPFTELLTEAQRSRCSGQMDDGGRAAFTTIFNLRFGQTSRAFWASVGRRRVTAGDLSLLSRFRDLRTGQLRLRDERARTWDQWAGSFNEAA